MKKSEIIKQVGCLRNLVIASCISISSLIATFFCVSISNEMRTIQMIAMAIFAIVFFTSTTLAAKELPILISVLRGKYEIKICKLLSVKFRHPYQAGDDPQRSLEFAKFKLTVDKSKAEEFDRGDMIAMVFLNNVEYPIVITKAVTTK